jgi:hypothetical protein
MIRVLIFCLFGLVCSGVVAQEPPKQDVVQEVSENKFRRALLKAAQTAAANKEISRVQVIQLRVASLSPAFLAQAERLAVVQMAFSGEEVPTDADGKIEVSRIDWEGLAAFLERIIPLILKLIDLFAFNSGGVYHAYA